MPLNPAANGRSRGAQSMRKTRSVQEMECVLTLKAMAAAWRRRGERAEADEANRRGAVCEELWSVTSRPMARADWELRERRSVTVGIENRQSRWATRSMRPASAALRSRTRASGPAAQPRPTWRGRIDRATALSATPDWLAIPTKASVAADRESHMKGPHRSRCLGRAEG